MTRQEKEILVFGRTVVSISVRHFFNVQEKTEQHEQLDKTCLTVLTSVMLLTIFSTSLLGSNF